MRIYLASKYSNKLQLRKVRDVLEGIGHEVVSRWIDEPDDPNIQIEGVSAAQMRMYCNRDFEDIDRAELLVHFQSKDLPNVRGGALVEFGVALAKGKDVAIVGDRMNIFDFQSDVMYFKNESLFIVWATLQLCDELWGRPGVKTAYQRLYDTPYHNEASELKEQVPVTSGYAQVEYRCWCGRVLKAVGTPDFLGDKVEDMTICTMSYKCPIHDQMVENPVGIGISGKAGSGKDTLAGLLKDRIAWPVTHFADELKREWYSTHCAAEYALTRSDVVETVNKMKLNDPEVRQSLIEYGQWRREQDPLYWVKKMDLTLPQIIADVRFPNEFEHLRKNGFFMVRIECTDEVLTQRGYSPIDDPSEKSLDNETGFDITISNNLGLDVLDVAVNEILKSIQSVGSYR